MKQIYFSKLFLLVTVSLLVRVNSLSQTSLIYQAISTYKTSFIFSTGDKIYFSAGKLTNTAGTCTGSNLDGLPRTYRVQEETYPFILELKSTSLNSITIYGKSKDTGITLKITKIEVASTKDGVYTDVTSSATIVNSMVGNVNCGYLSASGLNIPINSFVKISVTDNNLVYKGVNVSEFYIMPATPRAPSITGITPGDGQLSVAFNAGLDGGSAITSYKYSIDNGATFTTRQTGTTESPIVITGLTNGTSYNVQIKAVNANGDGTATGSTVATPLSPNVSVLSNTNISNLSTAITTVSNVTVSDAALTIDIPSALNNLTASSGARIIVSQPLSVSDKVTINANSKMELSSILTVTGDLILKANKDTMSFNLNIGSGGINVNGNVRYLKTIDNSRWYFMSFPCDVLVSQISLIGDGALNVGHNWWIKYYDGATRVQNLGTSTNWKLMTIDSTLHAYKGYIFGISNSLTGDYTLSIPLDKSIVANESSHAIPVIAHGTLLPIGENHKGWNLIGQPYLSKFNGSSIGINYLTFSNGAGSYSQLSKNAVFGINPFEAYFVQADAGLQNSGVSFDLGGRRAIPSAIALDEADIVKLSLTTTTGTDNTNLILDDAQSTAYQIGQDLEKWIGTDKSQVYSTVEGINYAYNALPVSEVRNLPIGFYSKTAGVSTINANSSKAKGLSALFLTDKENGNITDLMTSSYNFKSEAGTFNSRFLITAQRISTKNNLINSSETAPLLVKENGKLIVKKLSEKSIVKVYDSIGRLISNNQSPHNTMEIKLLTKGVYTIQIKSGVNISTTKILN